ncbi:retinol-binding protein pinta isoform X2 [Anabrus simplex]
MSTLRPLSPELQEIARKEIGEEPHRTVVDLEHIKEWLKKQPHITARLDDQFLLAFLRGCKFSLERTKEKLDCFYTMRTAIPEYFACRDPLQSEMQEMLKLGVLLPLPEPDKLGRRVLLQRMGRYDPSRLNAMHMFKLTLLLADIMMIEDDISMINGSVFLMDMDGVTLSHAMQLQPTLIKKTMMCFQNGYPARLKAIHYVNYPPTFESFLQIFKPFLKDKILNRIFLHPSLEALCENIPKRVLPKDYGGDVPSTEELAVTWKKKVESYRDYYLEDVKYKCDEKKRPGRPKTQEDLFGIEGSFRQLAVD